MKKMNDVSAFLTLLAFFSHNQAFSLKQVAQATAIPERTVQRYIKKFRDAGIAIKSDSGHGGGYTIQPSAKLPRLISAHELVALLFSFQTLDGLSAFPFDEFHFPQTRQRLLASLPPKEKQQFMQWQEVVQFSLSKRQLAAPYLVALRDAAIAKQILRITYSSISGERERMITPLGIYMLDGVWYCPAYCHSRLAERLFRVDRIQLLETLEIDPKPHRSLSEWRDYYDFGPTDWTLKVSFTERGKIIAQSLPWMDGFIADGIVTIPIQSGKKQNIVEDLLSFGPEIYIHEPAPIIHDVKQQLQATLAQYDR